MQFYYNPCNSLKPESPASGLFPLSEVCHSKNSVSGLVKTKKLPPHGSMSVTKEMRKEKQKDGDELVLSIYHHLINTNLRD